MNITVAKLEHNVYTLYRQVSHSSILRHIGWLVSTYNSNYPQLPQRQQWIDYRALGSTAIHLLSALCPQQTSIYVHNAK